MESSDLFSSLLQNPETMQQLASLASEVMGGMAPPPASHAQPTQQLPSPPAAQQQAASAPTAELMQNIMPALSAIAQSSQHAANTNRSELLHALRPFVSSNTRAQIDRAEHIFSMACMARAAAEQFLPQVSGVGQEV